MRTLPMLLAALSTPVLAAPEVIRFDASAPFDPATDFVDLVDFQPGAPDIRLSYFAHDPGGGSNAEVWYKQIIGAGWDPSGGNGLEVEAAISPQGYLGAGTAVPTATPGPWGVAHRDVFYGDGPDNYPLYRVAYEVFPFQDACLSCSYIESFLTMNAGIYYVALRWNDGGQTYHGWAAFEVAHLAYPLYCIPGIDWACDHYDLESLRQLRLRYVAAAYETEPDTPIVTGGGLCRADMNFDARFDFFDISAFLAHYLANDPAADFTGEGNLDFFDVSAFLAEYNAGCEF
jgi:hypothetical protein